MRVKKGVFTLILSFLIANLSACSSTFKLESSTPSIQETNKSDNVESDESNNLNVDKSQNANNDDYGDEDSSEHKGNDDVNDDNNGNDDIGDDVHSGENKDSKQDESNHEEDEHDEDNSKEEGQQGKDEEKVNDNPDSPKNFEIITVEPTCTTPGIKTFVNGQESWEEKIPPLGHLFDKGKITIFPTTTSDGEKDYKCTRENCNENYIEEFSLDEMEEAYSSSIVTPPTCENNGLKKYTVHTDAGDYNVDEAIPAIGHSFVENRTNVVEKHSLTNGGKCRYTCQRCSYASDETYKYSNCDFFYTEGLLNLCGYNYDVYPYLQRLWDNIESGLDNRISECINNNESTKFINIEVYRKYSEIPQKYGDVEKNIALLIAQAKPDKYWFLQLDNSADATFVTCSSDNRNGYILGRFARIQFKGSFTFSKASNNSNQSTIANIKSTLDSKINKNTNDLDILYQIWNYIKKNFTYWSDKSNWVFDYIQFYKLKKGICQGYARFFQFCAYYYGIPSLLITSPTHMWNWCYVNGKWYSIDCTNNYDYSNFLKKKAGSSVLINDERFNPDKHIYSDCNLIGLIRNGKRIGLFASYDEALTLITDETADYEICFGYLTSRVHNYSESITREDLKCKSLKFSIFDSFTTSVKVSISSNLAEKYNVSAGNNVTLTVE